MLLAAAGAPGRQKQLCMCRLCIRTDGCRVLKTLDITPITIKAARWVPPAVAGPADWMQQPGVCEPWMRIDGRTTRNARPAVQALLRAGLLHEGQALHYVATRAGKTLAIGFVVRSRVRVSSHCPKPHRQLLAVCGVRPCHVVKSVLRLY